MQIARTQLSLCLADCPEPPHQVHINAVSCITAAAVSFHHRVASSHNVNLTDMVWYV